MDIKSDRIIQRGRPRRLIAGNNAELPRTGDRPLAVWLWIGWRPEVSPCQGLEFLPFGFNVDT